MGGKVATRETMDVTRAKCTCTAIDDGLPINGFAVCWRRFNSGYFIDVSNVNSNIIKSKFGGSLRETTALTGNKTNGELNND